MNRTALTQPSASTRASKPRRRSSMGSVMVGACRDLRGEVLIDGTTLVEGGVMDRCRAASPLPRRVERDTALAPGAFSCRRSLVMPNRMGTYPCALDVFFCPVT